MTNTTQDTLDLIKVAQQNPLSKSFTESSSATSGLTSYDLQASALKLYPVLTPLRNIIPRVSGSGGIQANWRAITGINTSQLNAGVSEKNRGGVIAHTTADYFASYRGIGLEDSVTYESVYASAGFDDTRARAVEGLLRSMMIAEESIILGGNTSVALGTTPTPTLTASTTGGTLATQTLSVICVALGFDAWWAVGGFNNGMTGSSVTIASATVPGQISRSNAGGTTDTFGGGAARKSSAQTASVTGSTGSCKASVTPVVGAVGYAWYWGAGGSEVLGAITSINSVNITATATGAQTAASLSATDYSTNALEFDGILTQIAKSGSGAYYSAQPTGVAGTGTPLTSNNAGGIVEIDTAFASFWTNYRLSPDTIYVNSQELINISNKVIAGGAAALYRFQIDANNPGGISAGSVVSSYLNKITNTQVNIQVHPLMPAGTMMFYSSQIPYKLSNVTNVVQIRTRQDYYQIEWPRVQRSYDYGVYSDEVLQNYFPPAFGVITNIANG